MLAFGLATGLLNTFLDHSEFEFSPTQHRSSGIRLCDVMHLVNEQLVLHLIGYGMKELLRSEE